MSEKDWIPTRRAGKGGVEVRAFGEGTADLRGDEVKPSGEDEETPELRLSEEDRDGDEPGSSEEVVRLDREAAPLSVRRMEDQEPAAPVHHDPRGGKKLGQKGLTLIMACISVPLALVGVVVVTMIKGDSPEREAVAMPVGVAEESDDFAASDSARTNEIAARSDELIESARKVMERYAAAESVDDVLDLVRKGRELEPLLREKWEPVEAPGQTSWKAMDHEGTAVILMSREDTGESNPGVMVFVETGDGVLLDWEASMVVGDVEFGELTGIEEGREVAMRAILRRSNFHPIEYPDDEFLCYRIGIYGGPGDVFGYVRIGSEVAAALAEARNEGSVFFNQAVDLAAIIRLKNEGRGEFGQFLISGFVQKGWVEP